MSKKPHLKFVGISEKTLTLYKREVSLFLSHLEFNGERMPKSYSRLDQRVADYINHEGEALTRAGWLLSRMRRLYPRIRKELCVAQLWYNNWCRQRAPHSSNPTHLANRSRFYGPSRSSILAPSGSAVYDWFHICEPRSFRVFTPMTFWWICVMGPSLSEFVPPRLPKEHNKA